MGKADGSRTPSSSEARHLSTNRFERGLGDAGCGGSDEHRNHQPIDGCQERRDDGKRRDQRTRTAIPLIHARDSDTLD